MANWLPWRNMMERNHPQDYADVRNLKRRERESLAVKPRRMTEQQWMDALAELKLDENRMVYNTTIRLTRDYLEENEEEAQ
jgi:hypothetical protein